MKDRFFFCTALILFVFAAYPAFSFDIKPYVFNECGQVKSSSSFQLVDSIGEPVAGVISTGGSFKLLGGFWDTQGTVILSTDIVVWVHDFVAECEYSKATGAYLALASIPVAPGFPAMRQTPPPLLFWNFIKNLFTPYAHPNSRRGYGCLFIASPLKTIIITGKKGNFVNFRVSREGCLINLENKGVLLDFNRNGVSLAIWRV